MYEQIKVRVESLKAEYSALATQLRASDVWQRMITIESLIEELSALIAEQPADQEKE